MKQLILICSQFFRRFTHSARGPVTHSGISSALFYTLTAAATFFLVVTAQLFWSTIHGDGAVYSWIAREIGEAGIFSSQLPAWDQTRIFAEHPYLFFYFSTAFTSWLGYSDLALKIPNFMIAAASLALLWLISHKRHRQTKSDYSAHIIGLIAAYVLILNPNYIMQISQPSLDPMAQLLALLAAALYILYRRPFASGIFLGLAFLTKGLELLPHLAAISLIVCYSQRGNLRSLVSELALGAAGVALPLAGWLAYDQTLWQGQWLSTYWNRQFAERFLTPHNTQVLLQFDIVLTLIQAYALELMVLAGGIIFLRRWKRAHDLFFLYFVVYAFFNLLAFMLIKKDSSQHLTGILLFGSLFVAEYLWDLSQRIRWRSALRTLPVFLFAIALGYWSWFIMGVRKNPDLWTAIKNESVLNKDQRAQLPIVVQSSTPEGYGFFYTIQWYFPSQTVYSPELAKRHLVGRKVLLLAEKGDGRLSSSEVIYAQ